MERVFRIIIPHRQEECVLLGHLLNFRRGFLINCDHIVGVSNATCKASAVIYDALRGSVADPTMLLFFRRTYLVPSFHQRDV